MANSTNRMKTLMRRLVSHRLPWYISEKNIVVVLAIAIGALTALALWLFHEVIHYAHIAFQETLADETFGFLGRFGLVLALGLAGLIVGGLMQAFVGHEKYHGVSGIIERIGIAGGRLPFATMPAKALASALSLGSGSSVGPEDPSVQIGANIGSYIAQKLHLDEEYIPLLVSAGAASAIAAAFDAPIAGVFFALEIILRSEFNTRSVSLIIIAAVISAALTQGIGGAPDVLGPFEFRLNSLTEIPLFVPLGVVLAPFAAGFIRLTFWQARLWHRLDHLPWAVKTAIGGVMVGFVGAYLPEILGGGRDVMNDVMRGDANYAFEMLLLIALMKMLMTSISQASGFVGGIFAPALFAGTMIGDAYGEAVTWVGHTGDPRAFAIAGMAGMMAGVVRAPITAIMLVFELTNDYRFILPIMLVSGICILISEMLEQHGVYQLALVRQGIVLQNGRDIDLMQSLSVAEAMHTPAPTISHAASLVELRDALRAVHKRAMCVLDAEGELCGVVTLTDLQNAYANPELNATSVGDICTRQYVSAAPDDVLWSAIRKMADHGVGRLPVVNPRTRQVVGMVNRSDIVNAYNTAIHRKMHDQHTAEQVRLNALTGTHVYEKYVTKQSAVVDRALAEVKLPAEAVVASITRKGKLIIPHGHTVLRAGDTLTIVADPHVEGELSKLFAG